MCCLPQHPSVCCNWCSLALFSFQTASYLLSSSSTCLYKFKYVLRVPGDKRTLWKEALFYSELAVQLLLRLRSGSSMSVAQLVPFCNNVLHNGSELQISLLPMCDLPPQIGHNFTYEHWLGFIVFSTPHSTSAMVVWQNCLSLHFHNDWAIVRKKGKFSVSTW